MERRPCQIKAFEQTVAAIAGGAKRICVTSPTGSGKTLIITDLIQHATSQDQLSALYTYRRMLFEQTTRFAEAAGIEAGKRAAGHIKELHRGVQICMTQTEASRVYKKKDRNLHPANIVLIDECHSQKSGTMLKIMADHLADGAVVAGFTATPLNIGDLYDELIVAGTVREGFAEGYLVPAQTFGPDEPDLKHIRQYQVGEDLSEPDNVKAIMRPGVFGRVLKWYRELNPDQRPTLLFGPDVKGSLFFAEQFSKAGIKAAHIDGDNVWIDGEFHESDSYVRRQVLDGSQCGDIKVICNRYVMREGIDAPWLSHGIFATVFGSLTSFLQSGGRMLRACDGKDFCTIQDHGGCLDEKTEILTRRGWLGIDSMCEDDTIATMNMTTGDCEWSCNLGTIRKQCDSKLLTFSSHYTEIRVTDYHNMIIKSDTRGGKWRTVTAGELWSRKSNAFIPTATTERVSPAPLTDHEIAFLGWFLTDGTIEPSTPHQHRGYRNRIRIFQSANAPESHHAHIIGCLDGCGFRYSVSRRAKRTPRGEPTTLVTYSISSGRKSSGGWKRLDQWLHKDFPEIYETLDARQFSILLEAMNLGDGSKQSCRVKSMALAVADDATASRIQSLAVRRGYRCNRRFQTPPADKPHHKGVYILNLVPSSILTVATGSFSISAHSSSERVWCVQTVNGTIITRRNGKVAIMGNSWHRHGSLNEVREWSLELTNHRVVSERQERMREKLDPQPIACPKCAKIRESGRKCPFCGYESHIKSRMVVQVNGDLKPVKGDVLRPRYRKSEQDTAKKWEQMYYRMKRAGRTFRQAEGLFCHENGYFPPHNLPRMPKDFGDWFRRVDAVPQESLT